ncbi:MAG: CinA family nicotinamide mononucleotide deamidase-related protein [Bradymonadales bacterium]|nr:CinA family nicotinamide mononucleotide deamidase-related protein [Bradymonadales bacterium]
MEPQHRIEILCIGDELLDGRTADRNAFWFGQRLTRTGLRLARATVVHDDPASILDALNEAAGRASFVLVSGGLGPTEDDRTRDVAARWAGTELVEVPEVLVNLEKRYLERGMAFPQTNRRQAMLPRGAEILPNEVGTAPGFRMVTPAVTLAFVPGVPAEFRWFVETHVLGALSSGEGGFCERSWGFFGITESQLAAAVESLQTPELSFHYIPRFPEVKLFVRGQGDPAEAALDRLAGEIMARVGSYLVTEGEESLVERLGRRLVERSWTLATAESCTGGMLGQMITSVSGSSAYYQEGFITYSNRAKMGRLGVPGELLDRCGAVSAEVAAAMAAGARERAAVEVALSVTGIAGPQGGRPDKPVGTVFVGMATPADLYVRELKLYRWDRNQIRTLSAWSALSGLLWSLENRLPEHLMRRV